MYPSPGIREALPRALRRAALVLVLPLLFAASAAAPEAQAGKPCRPSSKQACDVTPRNVRPLSATQTEITLGWDPPPSPVVGYNVYRDTAMLTATASTQYVVSGLTCGGSYSLSVEGYDTMGHTGMSGVVASTAPCPDTQAPTPPSALSVTEATTTSLNLFWSPSVDNFAVAGYGVYLNGVLVGSSAVTSYLFDALACGTSYTLAVDAVDVAGNRSGKTSLGGTTAACSAPAPTPTSTQTSTIRAAFYYPWFPETWTVNGAHVSYNPTLGYYGTTQSAIQAAHIGALDYAGFNAAISSWWGQGHYSDTRLKALMAQTSTLGSPLKWAVYYEVEGSSNPTAAQLASDLTYIRDNLASSPAYLKVNGRFVVFVYNADDLTCEVADRWEQANALAGGGAYVDLKVMTGYKTCPTQPDSWHQYAPAVAKDSQSGYSFAVSPGFWRADEATARLGRDLTRFKTDVASMVASNAPWQLVTTFNEWGEGTATESAAEWSSASGYGAYLDALHDAFGGAPSTTTPPAPADTTAPTTPGNLAISSRSSSSVTLAWSASTDNVAVTAYSVTQNGTTAGTTSSISYQLTGLACGQSFTFSVTAKDAAGNTSQPASITGSTTACPAPTTDPVIAAAGDIACDPGSSSFSGGLGSSSSCRQKYTSDLLVNAGLAQIITLGDNQYEDNVYSKYLQSFDPSWGRVKSLIRPGIGNHEYLDPAGSAAGYFQYFGSAAGDPSKGYYSFDVGSWHLIALNSNCSEAGGCGAGSPEETWLKADLAAHPTTCTLAYWHHPRWSSGQHGSNTSYAAFWTDLYNAGADLVLNGHDHDYERFAPQTPSGAVDTARGIRQFVVGTGGKNHYGFTTVIPNSEVRNSDTYGVLKLALHPSSYDWNFVPEAGKTFTDSGSGSCH